MVFAFPLQNSCVRLIFRLSPGYTLGSSTMTMCGVPARTLSASTTSCFHERRGLGGSSARCSSLVVCQSATALEKGLFERYMPLPWPMTGIALFCKREWMISA
eukprot:scaffold550_cov238-Pinguiococcus_pyrenoidosus.AAC.4